MAKKLDPQEIEKSRRKKTRADNREERKERIHDGIRKNRESGGVIVIPPPLLAGNPPRDASAPRRSCRWHRHCPGVNG